MEAGAREANLGSIEDVFSAGELGGGFELGHGSALVGVFTKTA
jgi:hypothetical protein